MISKAIQKLAKRFFIFIVVALTLGFPLSLFIGSYFNEEPNLETMSAANYLTISAVFAFTTIIIAILV